MGKPEQNELDPSTAITLTMAQFSALLEKVGAGGKQDVAALALETAKAHQTLNERDNRNPPNISVYTYPEGDTARPRPEMRCKTLVCGFPVDGATDTAEEMELLNLVQPGRYVCTKADGSKIPAVVKMERDEVTGQPSRVLVEWPTHGQHRHGLMSRAYMLREILAQQTSPVLVSA